jgi:hypothetical protein
MTALREFRDFIFGKTEEDVFSPRQITKGIAAPKMNKLNAQADAEIERLKNMTEMDTSYEEVAGLVKEKIRGLEELFSPSPEQQEVLSYFKNELADLREKLKIPESGPREVFDVALGRRTVGGPVEYRAMDFKEMRQLLKKWQNAAHEKGPLKDNGTAKQVAHNLKEYADAKAFEIAQSPLPNINAQRSHILELRKAFTKMVTDKKFQTAFTGRDDQAKQDVVELFTKLGKAIDEPDLPKIVMTKQFAAAIEGVYNTPGAFGSGSVWANALDEGLKEVSKSAFKYGVVGSLFRKPGEFAKFGAGVGLLKGVHRGTTWANPTTMGETFTNVNAQLDKLARLSDPKDVWQAAKVGAVPRPTNLTPFSPTISQGITEQFNEMPPEGPVRETAETQPTPSTGEVAQPTTEDIPDYYRSLKLDLSGIEEEEGTNPLAQ